MFSANICVAQTEEDYEQELKKIITSFNDDNFKSIYDLFDPSYQSEITVEDFTKMTQSYSNELGKIVSSEFWMEGERGNCYLLEFNDASMVLIFKLTSDKKITELHIEEY